MNGRTFSKRTRSVNQSINPQDEPHRRPLARAFPLSVLLLFALSAIAPVCGQEEQEAPPSFDRAREAFREAIERIWVPSHRLTDGPFVHAAFRDVVAEASKSTVEVRSEGKRGRQTRALGGIVGPDGWILTKASRIKEPVTVRLKDKRELDARVVGIDRDTDLAILKVAAKDLPSLHLSEGASGEAGAWVATPGLERDPVAIGVVSVGPRKIPHRRGILGIEIGDLPEDEGPGAMVTQVFDDTGAARGGVLVNDIIVRINTHSIKNRVDLQSTVGKYSPGDEIEIEVRRGERKVILKATLTGRVREIMRESRSDYQNSLGGKLSQRRFGFPVALQHDTVLAPEECGGPLVNLDGEVIGFNIARAGRTESYAIPTREVLPLMYRLMSGKQAPQLVEEPED